MGNSEKTGRGPVVAVDGPSGSGKSTVSRQLAQRLQGQYLDTGAMYRAVTWAVLQAGVDPRDTGTVVKIATHAELIIGTDPREPHISVDGVRVDEPIRGPEVTAAVSAVAAIPEVRSVLVDAQRAIVAEASAGGIVVEGRDIGSVVVPYADLKVFLTAAAMERARRRSSERATDLRQTAADMHRRDQVDSTRAADPLTRAEDAIVLDTTELGIDEVVGQLLTLVHRRVR